MVKIRLPQLSLPIRAMLFALTILTVAGGIFFVAVFSFERQKLGKAIGQELLAVVNSTAAGIDDHALEDGLEPNPFDDDDDSEYLESKLGRVASLNLLEAGESSLILFYWSTNENNRGDFRCLFSSTSPGDKGKVMARDASPQILKSALAGMSLYEIERSDEEGNPTTWFGDLIGEFRGILGARSTGAKNISAVAPVKDEMGKTVGVLQAVRPISPGHLGLIPLSGKMLAGGMLAVLPALLGGVWIASQFTREVKRLTNGINEVREGRLGYRVDAKRKDEIGEAQRGFNDMARYLEDSEKAQHDAIQQVVQSKKQAEIATAAKSNFLTNMSHEIRTPMNGIIGTISLLEETELSDSQKELSRIIRSSGQSLLHLINAVLDYSKLEQSKMVLEESPVDLRELVVEVLDMFAFHVSDCDIELICFIDPAVPQAIYGDFEKLKQVFVNLVGNAVKFTERGQILVHLSLKSVTGAQGEVPILHASVRDSGVGIPNDKLEVVFEAFSQADVSTTREYGGSGLGLAICRQLCQHMGGDISVESDVGAGSNFFFELPFRIVPNYEQKNEKEVAALKQQLAHKRVAIICQNETLRELQRYHFTGWGIESHAEDVISSEAIYRVAGFRPDVAIVDTRGQSEESITQFAAFATQQKLPRIYMLSVGENSSVPSCESGENPLCGELHKPIKEPEMLRALAALTCQPGMPSGAASIPSEAAAQNEAPSAGASVKKTGEFSDTYPAKVLLVEDVAMNQKIATMILAKLGYTADIANNGAEAVEMTAANAYDVILMDLQMPVMGGVEATREIRGNFHLPRQPIIIGLTGHALTGVRESCKEAGMNDFLTKPVEIDDIKSSIARCLDAGAVA